MTKPFSKVIGIIGGAGPMASCYLYDAIIQICQKRFGASDYKDFPEMLLLSYPFIRGSDLEMRDQIQFCITKLQDAGADLIGLANNSFHAFLPPTDDRFVNLIDETKRVAGERNIKKPLIFAAPKTIEMKLYEGIFPSCQDQEIVNRLIREVAGGTINEGQAAELRAIINASGPIDGIILACTELPLIHKKFFISSLPLLDTVQLLAERLIQLTK